MYPSLAYATQQQDNPIAGFLILLTLLLGYFIPAIVAYQRDHHNANAIFALDVLLGWTFIGWAIALIWALTGVRKA